MLTKRVIPCLDVKDGRVVKGVNFVNLRDAGDPVDLANAYDEQGADEVIFLDITATHEGRKTTIAMASRASEEVHIPYAVGGGFKCVDDMRQMIAAGADKVSLNSAALADPSIITAGALAFGSQAILVAIDAKRASDGSDRWTAYVHGGRKDTGIDAIEWPARQLVAVPARSCLRAWTAMAPRTVSTSRSRARSRAQWISRSSRVVAWASSSTSPKALSRARPMPCSRRASFTSASSRCAR